ncbi:MAG TPA: hypothetical protein VGM23_00280 [Armatimonadota bacterium]|jgi:hypothetical protein
MRRLLILLAAAALASGIAMAQVTTTTTTTSTEVVSTDLTAPTCPTTAYVAPEPCPVLLGTRLNGRPMVLVLGTREYAAFDMVPINRVGYSNTYSGTRSLFAEGNPLMYHQVNGVVTRHGNAYYPYYELPGGSRVAGLTEMYAQGRTTWPRSLSRQGRTQLRSVYNQYRSLTPAQAQAMGYQPLPQFIPGMGMVYLNTNMVTSTFDPNRPAAFAFSSDGRLLAVHYIVQAPQAPTVYGMQLEASPLVRGAWQLPVWLYQSNPNGMFNMMNPQVTMSSTTTVTTTGTVQ